MCQALRTYATLQPTGYALSSPSLRSAVLLRARAEPRLLVGKGVAHCRCCSSRPGLGLVQCIHGLTEVRHK